MKSIFEKLGGTYRQVGNVLVPDMDLSDRNYQIGKYGRMRHLYLKEHCPAQHSTMVLDGTLYDHLEEIDRVCWERMTAMVDAMKEQQGITEELKARDQLAWVGAMNNIRNAVEEAICTEVIYA